MRSVEASRAKLLRGTCAAELAARQDAMRLRRLREEDKHRLLRRQRSPMRAATGHRRTWPRPKADIRRAIEQMGGPTTSTRTRSPDPLTAGRQGRTSISREYVSRAPAGVITDLRTDRPLRPATGSPVLTAGRDPATCGSMPKSPRTTWHMQVRNKPSTSVFDARPGRVFKGRVRSIAWAQCRRAPPPGYPFPRNRQTVPRLAAGKRCASPDPWAFDARQIPRSKCNACRRAGLRDPRKEKEAALLRLLSQALRTSTARASVLRVFDDRDATGRRGRSASPPSCVCRCLPHYASRCRPVPRARIAILLNRSAVATHGTEKPVGIAGRRRDPRWAPGCMLEASAFAITRGPRDAGPATGLFVSTYLGWPGKGACRHS
jgi:hypothetical protein